MVLALQAADLAGLSSLVPAALVWERDTVPPVLMPLPLPVLPLPTAAADVVVTCSAAAGSSSNDTLLNATGNIAATLPDCALYSYRVEIAVVDPNCGFSNVVTHPWTSGTWPAGSLSLTLPLRGLSTGQNLLLLLVNDSAGNAAAAMELQLPVQQSSQPLVLNMTAAPAAFTSIFDARFEFHATQQVRPQPTLRTRLSSVAVTLVCWCGLFVGASISLSLSDGVNGCAAMT